ncbi:hypothetical protein F5Y14DRAFT_415059 [Nemania sp. NC0429]|nr:hypothetical protein F5Y14DRAFT_415059 [Nemania sp. NC0429]
MSAYLPPPHPVNPAQPPPPPPPNIVVWKNPSLVVKDTPEDQMHPSALAAHWGNNLCCFLLPTVPALKREYEKYQAAVKETIIPHVLSGVLDVIFHTFNTEVAHVKVGDPAKPVLKSIVKMLRTIHIIHPKGDGMGRTNWGTLLPLVLTKYGFGLPLGGKYGTPDAKIAPDFVDMSTAQDSCIDRGAMNFMFSGGYTIDEITDFLWLMQDHGLEARKRGEPTALFQGPASSYHLPVKAVL